MPPPKGGGQPGPGSGREGDRSLGVAAAGPREALPAGRSPWLHPDGSLKEGIYPNVPFDTYATWQAANHSVLRHMDKTPAHAYYEKTHQAESTEFQGLGHLIHQAVLEPALFKSKGPVVAPKVDRRTTVGKQQWAAFEAANPGREIILPGQMEVLLGLQRSIARHTTAREILYGFGTNELSLIWQDPVGVLCKGRIDRYTEYRVSTLAESAVLPVVVDVKTIGRPATTNNCERAVYEYGYHEQAVFYLRGLEILFPPDPGVVRKFLWLFCETDPPYAVRVFDADEAALQVGADQLGKRLRGYRECLESGVWPAWPEGIDTLGLPAWAYKRFDLE